MLWGISKIGLIILLSAQDTALFSFVWRVNRSVRCTKTRSDEVEEQAGVWMYRQVENSPDKLSYMCHGREAVIVTAEGTECAQHASQSVYCSTARKEELSANLHFKCYFSVFSLSLFNA